MNFKYFGTDGVRGRVNAPPVTPDFALRLGLAAARLFPQSGREGGLAVIGRDTRRSGAMLEAALVAGFTAAGMDVRLVGVLPTPAVARLARDARAQVGVMVTASHNSAGDNGMKVFDPSGHKLPDPMITELEALIDDAFDAPLATPEKVGTVGPYFGAKNLYFEAALASLPRGFDLSGLRIVIDCAHGAGHVIAPTILAELGADTIRLGTEPNGFNINAGFGSTDTSALSEAVRNHKADAGIALDGDGDRGVLVDEDGREIGGDQMLAMICRSWVERGKLAGGGVVGTIMTNLGFERHLAASGLTLERTAVGDRHVAAKMRAGGYNLGGEPSGHIVMSDLAPTGDGLMAALQALAVAIDAEQPLSTAGAVFEPAPQTLVNVRYGGGDPLAAEDVQAAIADTEAKLGASGRVVVRKSGTEPLVRIMVEAEDAAVGAAAARALAEVVEAASGD